MRKRSSRVTPAFLVPLTLIAAMVVTAALGACSGGGSTQTGDSYEYYGSY
ncbi:MAG: hypothetical protein U0174_16310 [Polyangiaceae bacterium]